MGQGGEILGSEAGIDSRTFHNRRHATLARPMSALGQKQTSARLAHVRFTPKSGHSPIKVMSEIRRLPLLRGSLTERVLFFDRNEVALQALLNSRHSAIWLSARCLPCVYFDCPC